MTLSVTSPYTNKQYQVFTRDDAYWGDEPVSRSAVLKKAFRDMDEERVHQLYDRNQQLTFRESKEAIQSGDRMTHIMLDRQPSLAQTRDFNGNTLLHYACEQEGALVSRAVSTLVTHRGTMLDPNARNDLGQTPLHKAAQNPDISISAMDDLLRMRAQVDAQDRSGNSPLYNAVLSGQTEKVEFLLSKGANPDLPNREELTPRQLAKQQAERFPGTKDIADLIASKPEQPVAPKISKLGEMIQTQEHAFRQGPDLRQRLSMGR